MSSNHHHNAGTGAPVRHAQNCLERDFKNWLMSLHSGDFQATHAAFAALKNDFQSLPVSPAERPHDSILP